MRTGGGRTFGAALVVALSLLAAGSADTLGRTAGDGGPGSKAGFAHGSPAPYRFDYFDNFYAVASGGAGTLWVVGNSGRIIHSADGGKSWVIQRAPVEENLNGVSFVDQLNGWACGNAGTIIHTADGGKSWEVQKTGTKHPIFRIQFLTRETGYACGYFGLFLRTADGGRTWEDRSLGEDVTLRGMHFLDRDTGFIAGEFGTIRKTGDGGASFARLASPVPLTLFAVHFADSRTGYACGVDGTIVATTDGGRSWREEKSGIRSHLLGLGVSDGEVVAVGLKGSVTVRNGEGRWTPIGSKTLNWLSGVFVQDGGTGYSVGAHGTILRLGETFDKGGAR